MATVTAQLQHKVRKSSKTPLSWLRKAAFAENHVLNGVFGDREIFPCDYANSGGTLKIIERYLQETIDPLLAADTISSQRKLADLREDARTFIHKATNCSNDHVVIFTEGGFMETFASYLNALDIARLSKECNRAPVVLLGHDLGPSIHEIVRKVGAEPLDIQLTHQGHYDVKQMDAFLKFYKKQGRVLLGAFSVGDESTGTIQNTKNITGILHSYGALCLWDYSTTGAFMKIDMCPLLSYEGFINKDAAFIQCSRFLGGANASNILITHGSILRNSIFETVQEGVLAFCTVNGQLVRSISPGTMHDESSNQAMRKKLVASPVEAKAVFELKQYFGDCFLQKTTMEISHLLACSLANLASVHLVGDPNPDHSLPYFSLFFAHPQTEWALHPGFICALLRDLFGIVAQTCPASLRHLPPAPKLEYQRIIHLLLSNPPQDHCIGEGVMQVTFAHIGLMYFMRDVDLEFLVATIKLIAEEGWRLLPLYKFNVQNGSWSSRKFSIGKQEVLTRTLSKIRSIQSSTQSIKFRHVAYIERAKRAILSVTSRSLKKLCKEGYMPQGDEDLNDVAKKHRWFMLPVEARELLDDTSPVRISAQLDGAVRKKGRSWPGISCTTPVSPSIKIANASYKRRFGHV